jgi:demethylmenaquinone methyltransferase/2-methoxy-6-polyprenyl-1,4-benzoquinol methylase
MVSGGEDKPTIVRRMFARIASRYDLMNSLMTFGRDRAWRRLAATMARRTGSGRALDVASGTGFLTAALAEQGFALAVGVDFCPEMVDVAVSRSRQQQTVQHLVGDGQCLPFPDAAFDAVTSGYALRNFGSIPTALAEMARVLKPGGMMVHLELTRPAWPPIAWAFRPYLGWFVPRLGQIVTGDLSAYAYLPDSLERHPSPAAIAGMMRSAGLEPDRPRLVGLGTVAIHSGVKR